MVVISAMMGGWLAYAQTDSETETRTEISGHDCGTGGEDHRVGRPLVKSELAVYENAGAGCKIQDANLDAKVGDLPDVDHNGGESLGCFTVTAYTAGFESCGKHPDDPLYGITATGAEVQENHTIASDWDVLPPGTRVRIEGLPYTYIVEDRGGAVKGKHIDLYIENLDDALEWGVKSREVWLVE